MLGILLLLGLVLGGCASTSTDGPPGSPEALPTGLVGPVAPTPGPGALRYVALGDSYTYGDGVRQADRWPNQLARILRPDLDIELAANLSGRSTATQELIGDQLPQLMELRPQFVSVQVGVNDAIFDTPPETYSSNMARILDSVLGLVPADRVVVVTTPDFTLTPERQPFDTRGSRSGSVSGGSTSCYGRRRRRGASRSWTSRPSATACRWTHRSSRRDGLHPSGKQYAGWADLIAERVRQLFVAMPGSPGTSGSPSVEGSGPVAASPAGGPAGSVSP